MIYKFYFISVALSHVAQRYVKVKNEKSIRERPTLYEWKSLGDANVEFQFRTSSSGTDQGFKLRLRCDRK